MLEKMWLFRFYDGLRFPHRMGPFDTNEYRREVIEEIWEQEPKAELMQVDVYKGGDVRMVIPTREVG